MPDVNSAESFGIFPGDPGFETFDADFPAGDPSVAAPVDFQETPLPAARRSLIGYDDIMGNAWRLRGEGKVQEAEEYLRSNGIRSEGHGDGR